MILRESRLCFFRQQSLSAPLHLCLYAHLRLMRAILLCSSRHSWHSKLYGCSWGCEVRRLHARLINTWRSTSLVVLPSLLGDSVMNSMSRAPPTTAKPHCEYLCRSDTLAGHVWLSPPLCGHSSRVPTIVCLSGSGARSAARTNLLSLSFETLVGHRLSSSLCAA